MEGLRSLHCAELSGADSAGGEDWVGGGVGEGTGTEGEGVVAGSWVLLGVDWPVVLLDGGLGIGLSSCVVG